MFNIVQHSLRNTDSENTPIIPFSGTYSTTETPLGLLKLNALT